MIPHLQQHPRHRPLLKSLLRDERGAVAIMLTVYMPVFVGFLTLAVDMSYIYRARNMLQVTAEAAALAATAQLPDNGPCTVGNVGSSACDVAKRYASRNMTGPVLDAADVRVGKWTDGCLSGGATDSTCFADVAGTGQTCVAFGCNSVKVTTRQAAANGNQLTLVFAQALGIGGVDVNATAIAVYGAGQNGAQPRWNAIIVQDISGSFVEELPQGKAADQALLECMHKNAGAGSTLGITVFAGCSGTSCNPSLPTYRSRISATDDSTYNELKNKIGDPNDAATGIQICTNNDADSIAKKTPKCSTGTSQASGMQTAFNQFCPSSPCTPAGPTGSRNSMIIVSDGEPTQTSANMCGAQQCTVGQLKQKAVDQANAADAQGIDIYTIFYGPNGTAADWLATLRRGHGISLKTPDPNQLSTLMGQVCASMPHRLVW